MVKISKIYPRDVIALFVLMFALVLIAKGINHVVSGIVIMIVTFYFAQRTDENPKIEKDLTHEIKSINDEISKLKAIRPRIQATATSPERKKPVVTGDFKLAQS